jgi:nitroreductase
MVDDEPFSRLLAEVIRNRRSIRDYLPEPIDREEILDILTLAGRAPSAWNLQPWRFVAVTDAAERSKLRTAAFNQPQLDRAPVVIVLYSDMIDALDRVDAALHPELPAEARAKTSATILNFFAALTPAVRDQWGRSQANIALGYLLLVIESRGYGSSPMLGFDPARVKALFGLPTHAEVAALVAFGRPAEEGLAPHRLDVGGLARFA